MVRDFRFSYIWGKSAKFGGQKVGIDHALIDEDVLTIVKRSNTP
jgi:ribosome-interacting GTPase 1